MFELIQVSDKCFYIDAPSKIGVIRIDGNNVCLIDSGNDKDAGKKVARILDENSWKLMAIYNTHSHADHIGGNAYLQEKYKCDVFCYGIECDFTNHTVLEPALLYGGYPSASLRHKFLMAKNSAAKPMCDENLLSCIKKIDLAGHSFDMVGFETDNVVFLADALSSKETLDKYGIVYVFDVQKYLETLEKIKNFDGKLFIPSHANVTDDIKALATYNIEKVYQVRDSILEILSNPCTFEEILKKIFDKYALKMSHEQYALIGSTLHSYLSWLFDIGDIQSQFSDNYQHWYRTCEI